MPLQLWAAHAAPMLQLSRLALLMRMPTLQFSSGPEALAQPDFVAHPDMREQYVPALPAPEALRKHARLVSDCAMLADAHPCMIVSRDGNHTCAS